MIKKSELLWNSIASIVAAMLNAILLLCCTRINGTDAAGIFSIAFATSVILNAIGDFGIRVYQVTDTKGKYRFGEYLALRLFVVLLMLLVGIAFVLISGYETEKMLITLLLIVFRMADNLSETYQGEFQKQGRLDLGGKSVVLRNLAAIIVFAITDYVTKNMMVSTIALAITNFVIFFLFDLRIISKFNQDKMRFQKNIIWKLVKECFPVFISTILSLYIMNAVKYAIDTAGNNEMQTYYNIIYLPAFTINLASLFIIKPMLKVLGDVWNEKKYKEMGKIIAKISAIIVGVTIAIELVCYTIGLPILGTIYGLDLGNYQMDLGILVLSGGFYALSVLFFYVLTTMRKQRRASIAYGITSLFALSIPPIFVEKYGMSGATISNLFITIILSLTLIIFFWITYQKETKVTTK